MNILTTLKQALDDLKAVLCDPEGAVCITGSDGDRTVTQQALANFSAAINQIEKAEPVAWVHPNTGGLEPYRGGDWASLKRGAKLYIYPPDAQAEIERLTKERDDRLSPGMALMLKAEISELRQQLAEREGWQLVPKDPTKDMLEIVLPAGLYSVDQRECLAAEYKDMLSAAPKPGDIE